MDNIDPNKAVNTIYKTGQLYAHAKASRVYLEQYRKSKKAMLIQEAPKGTMLEKESYAYSHADYLEILSGLKEAVELEEKYKFEIKAAELRVETWRTMQANQRKELNASYAT